MTVQSPCVLILTTMVDLQGELSDINIVIWLIIHLHSSFPDDWDVTASAELQQLFFNPKASKAAIKDAFLVQQGNIYVTQVSTLCDNQAR